MESSITSKGQATIPKAIREHLGVSAGGRIKFFEHPDGSVYILPVLPAAALRGVVKYKGQPVSVEQMNTDIEAAAAERHRKPRHRA